MEVEKRDHILETVRRFLDDNFEHIEIKVFNCGFHVIPTRTTPNLKSKNNSQHIKPESTIEADSCRPCETQKDKIVDTSHNLKKQKGCGNRIFEGGDGKTIGVCGEEDMICFGCSHNLNKESLK